MEALWISAGQLLLEYGMPGVAIIYLLRDREGLKTALKNEQDRVIGLMEKRIEESKASVTSLLTTAAQVERLTAVVERALDRDGR